MVVLNHSISMVSTVLWKYTEIWPVADCGRIINFARDIQTTFYTIFI